MGTSTKSTVPNLIFEMGDDKVIVPVTRSILYINSEFQVHFQHSRPNWWWRMWGWILLGWKWV